LSAVAGTPGLECVSTQCVHRAVVDGYELAFWFNRRSRSDRTCLSRVVRLTREEEDEAR
jgi:hypothetical protein